MELMKAEMKQRADICWELMNDDEKSMVRFGLSPHWTALEDLDGKHKGMSALKGADEHRLAAVALMNKTKEIGGMVV